ncbi:UDP-N-acetylmuramate--L-alanine ligase [Candidatus Marinimicrobia bacterium MT.SAG.4]|nr:UDP-N-acetylmuramate--L-alanine ligase [Candidatus Marinimicrobia bacterium MT.SAG.4]
MMVKLGHTKHLHFIGVGGIGMSGLAELLLNQGYTVSGSDMTDTDITRNLQKMGGTIFIGHSAENIGSADVVVHSSAVKNDNPEIVAANEKGIPVIRRAEMLAELVRLKPYAVAVAGTHGKTTTTSIAGMVMTEAGLDPTIIVGGVVRSLATNARLGDGDYIVAEADEFDRSFLTLSPTIAIITNIEIEHLDIYKDLDDIKNTFITFASRVPFYGAVIACIDEEHLREILPDIKKRIITYGLDESAEVRAVNISYESGVSRFNLINDGDNLGEIRLRLPGVHNVKNALGVIALSFELDIPFETVAKALNEFEGVLRRFEIKKRIAGMMIVDDYAHHPTEVKSSLSAAQTGWDRRVIAVFQPHLYSRTRDFKDEFGSSFNHADVVIITDIYPAREAPIEGVTGKLIADAVESSGHKEVHYLPEKEKIADFLMEFATEGDMIITIGAGDIFKVGEEFIQKLETADKDAVS